MSKGGEALHLLPASAIEAGWLFTYTMLFAHFLCRLQSTYIFDFQSCASLFFRFVFFRGCPELYGALVSDLIGTLPCARCSAALFSPAPDATPRIAQKI